MKHIRHDALLPLCIVVLSHAVTCRATEAPSWKMVTGDLQTRWAKEVSPTNALPEYPRPALRRDHWKNLNGLWEFAIRSTVERQRPDTFDSRILVPFCAASALSGVKKVVVETDRLWYRRTFDVPGDWAGQRVLLHFGGVDWETSVWVNGREATHHRGGYDPFSVDITDMLEKTGPQELVVSVWDPSDKGPQMRGKQVIKPHGFNYTGASGIWQTVWLEPVPSSYIRSVYTVADLDENCVWVTVDTVNTNDAYLVEAQTLLPEPGAEKGSIPAAIEERAGRRLRLVLRKRPKARLWSPDSPFLYDLKVTLKDRLGHTIDTVDSYFGMREIAVGKDADGINRLLLNGKPLFQYGFLDQGWWPDGVYTAPTDAALRYDIETAKRLGANMLRKHVKVEPQRFYYWCDRLGILVWQDMPNGTNHTRESQRQYEVELKRNMDALRNHPSIVMWVAFNEGWGQFDARRHAEWIKHYDPSRLVDHASGWADRGELGDVRDIHIYPEPGVAPVKETRAIVLGEFGGIGMSVPGHEWRADEGHGHGGLGRDPDLTNAYLKRLRILPAMIRLGLSAACYTQIADQEIEVNGVMTYDRAFLKLKAERVAAATRRLYDTPPAVKIVLPTSQVDPQTWRYTEKKPAATWFKRDFDDTGWDTGPGGFGDFHPTFPTLIVPPRTTWKSNDIWIRRSFELDSTDLVAPHVLIHHDETAQVYVNDRQVMDLHHTSNFYTWYPMPEEMRRALRTGTNVLAVRCHNEHHPQYIDVGIVDVLPAAETPLAVTPPMGWNSWNAFEKDIDEEKIKAIADAMVTSGMRDAGYVYLVLDDAWMAKDRDADGRLVADPRKFPSGMKAIGDYIHAKGLKYGIYQDRGKLTCQQLPGSFGHEKIDMETFAAWGVDYIKLDSCFAENNGRMSSVDYALYRTHIESTGRPMVLSISDFGNAAWAWGGKDSAQLWRTSGDIYPWMDSIYHCADTSAGAKAIHPAFNGLRQFAAPGHWNDPDMLQVGNLKGMEEDRKEIGDRAHFSLWCILAAPLMAGNDLRTMSTKVREVLTAPELIAVNQDKRGIQGYKIQDDGDREVYNKPLSDGTTTVLLLNKGGEKTDITVRWEKIGLSGKQPVRDLWARKDLGEFKDSFTARGLGQHDHKMLKIGKPGAPLPTPAPMPLDKYTVTRRGETHLSDLYYIWKAHNAPVYNTTISGAPITIDGKTFKKGFGCKGKSAFMFKVTSRADRFRAVVAIEDDKTPRKGRFRVYNEDFFANKVLWDSGDMTQESTAKRIDIALKNVDCLMLVFDGDESTGIWADAHVIAED